jgi:hypothetical protein
MADTSCTGAGSGPDGSVGRERAAGRDGEASVVGDRRYVTVVGTVFGAGREIG